MRKLYILGLVLMAATTLNAQIVFESNLDSWNDSVPNDWNGSRTSLEIDSIMIDTSNPTYGTASAMLTNTETGHKRFNTQPIALEAGVNYEVEVWVRGEGQVRTNVFIGSSTSSSGYGSYNPYVDISSTELTSFTQNIISDTTSALQELIVSFRNGVVILDRVELRVGGAIETVSINDIQFTTDQGGASPYDGQLVTTSGTVSAVATQGFWLQDGTGPWSGVYAYSPGHTVSMGDQLTLTTTVVEFNGLTELTNLTDIQVTGSGTVAPTSVSTAAAASEEYEGVLVTVNAECVGPVAMFGEWTVDDGSGVLSVDDFLYLFEDPTVGQYYFVTGPMQYAFEAFKLLPRSVDDISLSSSVEEFAIEAVSFFPNPATDLIRIETTGFEGGQLTIIDAMGRVVSSTAISNASTELNIAALEAARYTIELRTAKRIGRTAIIKL